MVVRTENSNDSQESTVVIPSTYCKTGQKTEYQVRGTEHTRHFELMQDRSGGETTGDSFNLKEERSGRQSTGDTS
jgi:hypothetical protein